MKTRQRRILQLIIVCLILLAISFWGNGSYQQTTISLAKVELNQPDMQTAALADPKIAALLRVRSQITLDNKRTLKACPFTKAQS